MISFLTSKSTSYDPVNAYNKPPKTESTLSVSVDMKLLSPIYSTDDGSSTLLRLSHSAKAESLIHFTPSCIFTDSRFLQLKKAPFPIVSMLEGISTCIRSLQCENT